MSGIGLDSGYVSPEKQAAASFSASAQPTPSATGIGLTPSTIAAGSTPQSVVAPPTVSAPDQAPPSATPAVAPSLALAAAAAPKPAAAEPLIDFHKDPLGAIALVLDSAVAGYNHTESPVDKLKAQKLAEQAQSYKTASLALDTVEQVSNYVAKLPADQQDHAIDDLDARFAPALGGFSLKTMVKPIVDGKIKNAGAKIAALKSMGLAPAVLANMDAETVDKVTTAYLEGVAKKAADPDKTPEQIMAEARAKAQGETKPLAEIQAEAAARARGEKQGNPAADPLAAVVSKPLASYSPEVQSTVRAMLEGRMSPPTGSALRTPYWQTLIGLANQADPTFDQTTFAARAAAHKDMMGGGKSYQLLNSANTAIQHMGRLYDQVGDVAGHEIPLVGTMVNAAENKAAQASGRPGVNAYNDTLGHLAEETTKFYRGSGGAESDVQRNMANLDPSLSTAQKKAGIKNTIDLLYGKLQPMADLYNKAMGTNFPASHFLSSEAKKTLQRVEGGVGYAPGAGEDDGDAGGGQQVLHYDAKGNRLP